MKVLAVVNQKGGVGKTTTAVTLAHGMALWGLRVLLVDLDPQGNVADALGLEKGDGVGRMLNGAAPHGACGLFGEGDLNGNGRGVVFSGRPGLACVLGDKSAVLAREVVMAGACPELAVRDGLERFEGEYEVAVLDTAPGADVFQIGALVACTHYLVPVALEHLAVVGAVDVLGSAAALQDLRRGRGGEFLGVLPTMWDRVTNESQVQFEGLVREFGEGVLPPIPVDVRAREAPAHGRTLWEYGRCRALDGVAVGPPHTARGYAGPVVGGYRAVLRRVLGMMNSE